jgi:hypothetical protein
VEAALQLTVQDLVSKGVGFDDRGYMDIPPDSTYAAVSKDDLVRIISIHGEGDGIYTVETAQHGSFSVAV